MLPTFDVSEVDRLAYRYGECLEVKELRAIARSEVMAAGRDMRDYFVHRGRVRASGHSATALARWEGIQAPLSSQDHLAIAAAMFDQVLRPSVRAGADLLKRRRADLGFPPVAES